MFDLSRLRPQDMQINYGFFEKILNNTDFTKPELSALDYMRIVYEKTYMFYGMRFLEKQAEAETITAKMVEKVRIIDELERKVKEYEARLEALGESISAGSEEEAG